MNADEIQIVTGALSSLESELNKHGHSWTEGENAIMSDARACLERESVPAGLLKCKECGFFHAQDDACVPPPACLGEGDEWKG